MNLGRGERTEILLEISLKWLAEKEILGSEKVLNCTSALPKLSSLLPKILTFSKN